MKIHLNYYHLISRASERIRNSNGSPLRLTETELDTWRDFILNNAPVDWRFTENPAGSFLLTVIKKGVQVKILGQSHREFRGANKLYKDLHEVVKEMVSGAESRDIPKFATRYLKGLADSEAEICHELKTVFSTEMIPPSEMTTEQERDRQIAQNPHLILQKCAQVDRSLSMRPNAILLEGENGRLELWVRQGQPLMRVQTGQGNSESLCMFARLSSEGIVQSTGSIWAFNRSGVARQIGTGDCGTPPKMGPDFIPPWGSRSRSYWNLPTLIDAQYRQAHYAIKEAGEKGEAPDPVCVAEIDLMDQVYDKARAINLEWIKKNEAGRKVHNKTFVNCGK